MSQQNENAQNRTEVYVPPVIEYLMSECVAFREKIMKNEQELRQWRSDIAQGLRDDVDEANEFERTNKSNREQVEQHEQEVQDLQNRLAARH